MLEDISCLITCSQGTRYLLLMKKTFHEIAQNGTKATVGAVQEYLLTFNHASIISRFFTARSCVHAHTLAKVLVPLCHNLC